MSKHQVDKSSLYRQCKSKKRYKDEHQVGQMMKKRQRVTDAKLDYYYCVYCKGFHLTSKEQSIKGWE